MIGPKSYNSALFCPAHLQPCHTYRVSKDLTYSVLQPPRLGEEVTPALGRLLSHPSLYPRMIGLLFYENTPLEEMQRHQLTAPWCAVFSAPPRYEITLVVYVFVSLLECKFHEGGALPPLFTPVFPDTGLGTRWAHDDCFPV